LVVESVCPWTVWPLTTGPAVLDGRVAVADLRTGRADDAGLQARRLAARPRAADLAKRWADAARVERWCVDFLGEQLACPVPSATAGVKSRKTTATGQSRRIRSLRQSTFLCAVSERFVRSLSGAGPLEQMSTVQAA
jgi:hypothetical protein